MRIVFVLICSVFLVACGGNANTSKRQSSAPVVKTQPKELPKTTNKPKVTQAKPLSSSMPLARIETNLGAIVVELDKKSAPETVRNFLTYAKSGFYNGTVFHRVIDGFMIQGGGFAIDVENKQFSRKVTRPAIINEANNGLRNERGTIAMARTNDPDSATSQFYINTVNNGMLNYRPGSAGYCVFGKVIQGMDVVDKIGKTKTTDRDWPVSPIIMTAVTVTMPTVDNTGATNKTSPKEADSEIAEATESYFGKVLSFSVGIPSSVINVELRESGAVKKGDVLVVKQQGEVICTASVVRVHANKAIAEIAKSSWVSGQIGKINKGDEVGLK